MARESHAKSPPNSPHDSEALPPTVALATLSQQMEEKPSNQKRRKVEVEVEEEEDVLADLDDDELDPNQAEPEMMKCASSTLPVTLLFYAPTQRIPISTIPTSACCLVHATVCLCAGLPAPSLGPGGRKECWGSCFTCTATLHPRASFIRTINSSPGPFDR